MILEVNTPRRQLIISFAQSYCSIVTIFLLISGYLCSWYNVLNFISLQIQMCTKKFMQRLYFTMMNYHNIRICPVEKQL